MNDSRNVDLLIVGAGPVGLFGAFYAGVRTLSTIIVDSLEEPGGQITAMYPEKAIIDVAGFPSIKGRELVDSLVAQAAVHKPEYLLGQQVGELTKNDDGTFTVLTDKGVQINTRSIVITGGIGTFSPRPLPTGGEYLGRGLVHFVTDPISCEGQDVVVVGGGDSALDWALMLLPIAKSVTLVHRRGEFRAHPHSVEQVLSSPVQVLTDAQICAVRGEPTVAEVDVDVKGAITSLPCQKLVAALGFTANLGPLESWGLQIHKRSISVDSAGRTNIEGIFAAGDIVDYPGKVKLIVSGFGEVATAVNNVAAYLNPNVSAFPGHLSDYS